MNQAPNKDPQNGAKSAGKAIKSRDSVAIQALAMAGGTLTSRILGLVRDIAFSALFSKTVTDAWTVAFTLPNLFRRLLGEGSLSVSFIPIFVEARTQDPSGVRARNLVNGFYTLLLIILSVLTAVGIFGAEPIVRLIVEDHFDSIPGKFALTVKMARIMFCFIFFMSTYAYFMGILNALGKFGLAAAAPTLLNVAMILSNFVPREWQSMEGEALAWGVVIGGALQTGVLIPLLLEKGYFPRLSKGVRNSDITRVFRNMLPGMFGMGLLQFTVVINRNFSSSLGEGSNSAIYYADRLLELPLSLIAVSLGTALLPTLSRYWAENNQEKMTETANYYLRLALAVALPAAVGLYCLSTPIVEMLFMRGKFTAEDAALTAGVVQIYSFTVLASSCVRILVPSFYAIKNTWLPAAISAVCLLAHVSMAPSLIQIWGLRGLVISTLLSAVLNLVLLVTSYYWLIGNFRLQKVLLSAFKMALACAGLAMATQIYFVLNEALGSSTFARVLNVGLAVVAGASVYVGMCYVLRVEEVKHASRAFWNKLRSRLLTKA